MQFHLVKEKKTATFLYEKETLSGVKKVADQVRRDISLVSGCMPEMAQIGVQKETHAVFFATLGNSPVLEEMQKSGKLDLTGIAGKREVYSFTVVDSPMEGIEKALVIAGSDKRGTIYGLFHISDLLGVSPFVDWSDVKPSKQEEILWDETVNMVSKEPSVKYRGFFLNDEWPAFGTFCEKHFGGMNAEMYEMIFLLMLRLKGNYLWPAMWATCFAEEGPGLLSAELADEYGVVMGLSHHEPCLRHGEEYSKLRGKDSPYGDAWNFRTNREGIIRFWRDGLKRNGHLENVITLGMRGERDSAIMGAEATLGDNIDLLRDVINTQNELIKEQVNENLEEVPRMLALYKEVEPFFYGNEQFKGLMGDPCLSDVILLLCDDNHGYLRSRPDEKMLEHKGGYGLYYHFDYHGEPVSYEWVNSSYLPQVWEQLVEAYETGIRDLWIVNVGDLGFQEFPLSYFMDMAYDYEKWGIKAVNCTDAYTQQWVKRHFASDFTDEQQKKLCEIIKEYTRINHNRRPEHMSEYVYHPVHDREAEKLYQKAQKLIAEVETLQQCCKENTHAFEQLIAYQVKASMNYICMCLYRGWNRMAADMGLVIANDFAKKIMDSMETDERLRDDFHKTNNAKWDGLAAASHIGFCNWNDEEAKNPIIETVIPVKKSRLRVGLCESGASTCGEEWTRKRLYSRQLLDIREEYTEIFVGLCSDHAVEFTVSCDDDRIRIETEKGVVTPQDSLVKIKLFLQKDKLHSAAQENPLVEVSYGAACAQIEVLMPKLQPEGVKACESKTPLYVETDEMVCMHAEHFAQKYEHAGERFVILDDIAKISGGVKLFTDTDAPSKEDPSWLAYDFYAAEGGEYELTIETEPASPRRYCGEITIGYRMNEDAVNYLNMLPEGYEPGVTRSWEEGVLDHVRCVKATVTCVEGKNRLRIYAVSGENVVERMILIRNGKTVPVSYLGPVESIKM